MRLTRRTALTALLTIPAVLCTALLVAAPKYVTLYWEAENAPKLTGKIFKVEKRAEDMSREVSGKKVLSIPKVEEGKKIGHDEVDYPIRIPSSGKYYLWARTLWSTGCGNSVSVWIQQGKKTDKWYVGGDGTYDCLHWVTISDGKRPRPLMLPQGTVIIKLVTRESGAKIDQLLLTTDAKLEPAGIYTETPNVLEKKK